MLFVMLAAATAACLLMDGDENRTTLLLMSRLFNTSTFSNRRSPHEIFTTASPRIFNPDCNALIAGEESEMKITQEMLYLESHTSTRDLSYKHVDDNCPAFLHTFGYSRRPGEQYNNNSLPPVAYILLVQSSVHQLERLLHAIYSPRNIYCAHPYGKAGIILEKTLKAISACFENVFVSSHFKGNSSTVGISKITSQTNCIKDLMRKNIKWKYLINLDENDYPLRHNIDLAHYLTLLNQTNVIPVYNHINITTICGLTNYDSNCTPTMPSAIQHIPLFQGSTIQFLTRAFIKDIIGSSELKTLLNWLENVPSGEQIFWSTAHMSSGLAGGTALDGTSQEVVVMRRVGKDCRHADVEDSQCIFGIRDLPWLTRQPGYFARPFDTSVDHLATHCLGEWIKY